MAEKEVTMEMRKYFEMKKSENTLYQIFGM